MISSGATPLALPGGMAQAARVPDPPSEPLIHRSEPGLRLGFPPGSIGDKLKKLAFKKSKKAFK